MIGAIGLSLLPEGVGRAERWLAVFGGGALGFVLAFWLSGLAARAMFLGTIPRPARSLISLLGGVAAGWLAYYLLLSGLGTGGGSGDGVGPNTGNNSANTGQYNEQPIKNGTAATDKGTLRVEVLGDATLAEIAKSKNFDKDRRYRIESGKGPELLKLRRGSDEEDDGLEERIEKRLKQEPPLRVLEVVVYKDSPSASKNAYVTDLVDWARELRTGSQERLKVDIVKRDRKAPVP